MEPVVGRHHMRPRPQHIDAVKGREKFCSPPQVLKDLQQEGMPASFVTAKWLEQLGGALSKLQA